MKELKSLPLDERIKLARRCEPFFLAYKSHPVFRGVHTRIANIVHELDTKRYEPEIWTLISATTQTIRYDSDSVFMSFKKDNYDTANKITKKKIKCTRMADLVELLEAKGYLTRYNGYNFNSNSLRGVENAMRSVLIFHEEWFKLFDVKLCKSHGTAREFDLVIVKDKNGKVTTTKGLRGIGEEKKVLKDMNNTLDNNIITIQGQRVKPLYKSVFNNSSLDSGGRLYAGSFSTEKAELRPTIEINGDPCCEVDYKNMHFRILYNEIGIDFKDDCYAINCPDGWNKKELRTLTKQAGVILLNASSKSAAKKAINLELRSSKKFEYNTLPKKPSTVDYILKEMELLHEPIAHNFYLGEWDRLQNIDSRIAKQIIKAFNVLGVPILTYHDSFICQSEYRDYLIQTMREAWEIVLGDSLGFGFDIEFYNTPETVTGHLQEVVPLEVYPMHYFEKQSRRESYKVSHGMEPTPPSVVDDFWNQGLED